MAPKAKRNGAIDKQIEETFPASDPPSFMGGEVLGAPKGRHTPAPSPAPRKKTAKTKAKPKLKAAGKPKRRATKKRKSR
ncbi:MAG: hypothetical protein ACTHLR_11660 [Rhizomicrobium sp.]